MKMLDHFFANQKLSGPTEETMLQCMNNRCEDPELHQFRGAPGLMFTVGPLGLSPQRNSRGIAGIELSFGTPCFPLLSGSHTTRSRQYGDGHVLAETFSKKKKK